MCKLVLDIRDKPIEELGKILKARLGEAGEEDLRGLLELRLHGKNHRFIKFLLSRLTSHIEKQSKITSTFELYFSDQGENRYEIEHIWANKIEYHEDEFEQNDEFSAKRNMLGGLILLPGSINKAHGAAPYEKKLEHYYGQNLLAKSLHENCYKKNPAFSAYMEKSGLPFKPHSEFTKKDMEKRQHLYYEIAKEVWSLDYFDCR